MRIMTSKKTCSRDPATRLSMLHDRPKVHTWPARLTIALCSVVPFAAILLPTIAFRLFSSPPPSPPPPPISPLQPRRLQDACLWLTLTLPSRFLLRVQFFSPLFPLCGLLLLLTRLLLPSSVLPLFLPTSSARLFSTSSRARFVAS